MDKAKGDKDRHRCPSKSEHLEMPLGSYCENLFELCDSCNSELDI